MTKKIRLLELTLDTPAENLALDEVLLETVEHTPDSPEVLRIWESPTPFVVLGRSCKFAEEVRHEFCRDHAIPVLRRSSGGGTVVAGPGCLMYALVLRYEFRENLRLLDQAHRFVMEQIRQAVALCGISVTIAGTSDLAIGEQKVSGNAMRCLRNSFLYHGTLLYAMDPKLIASCLGPPARQPDYRRQREHEDFVTALPCSSKALKTALVEVWETESGTVPFAKQRLQEIASQRHSQQDWIGKL